MRLPLRLMPSSCAASILYWRMAAWEAFCDARAVTRPRPLAAGFFAAEEVDVLFFAVLPLFDAVLFFAAGADFVLLAVLRGPLARVLAALLRLLAVVLLEAMVFAAWVLLEAVGFFAVEEEDVLFFAVLLLFGAALLFAAGADFVLLAVLRVLLAPLAKVLAALLRAEALLLLLARVLAALLLPAGLLAVDLLVGICVSLL